jgi:hypothetical protein
MRILQKLVAEVTFVDSSFFFQFNKGINFHAPNRFPKVLKAIKKIHIMLLQKLSKVLTLAGGVS